MVKQFKVKHLKLKILIDCSSNFKLQTSSLLIYLFFLLPILTYSQVVDEVIPLDTTFETVQVIYQPSETSTYYIKKVAVFANNPAQIAIEKSYTRGVQNGIYNVYYPNGQLKVKTVYANNKLNGEWTWYNPEGTILVKGIYVNGIKHGFWAYKAIRTYGRYKNGLKHKKWYVLDANHDKIKSTYKKGVLVKGKGVNINNVIAPDTNYVQNDTLIVEATEPTEKPNSIKKEYQQAVDFLATNFLFKKKIKAHFKKDIQQFKKNYKKDVFQFVIETNVPTMEINTFLNLSKEGKVEVATIDSVLKADTETLKQNFNQTNIQLAKELANYSTNKDALVHVYFSEVNNQLLRVDVIWKAEKEVENNTYKILLYFNSEGILKGAEYQK